MERLRVRKLSELDDPFLEQTANLFVDGFLTDIPILSNDKQALMDAITHSFLTDHYYVGLLDYQVVGIIAYSTNQSRAHALNKTIMQQKLGRTKGWLAYTFFKREMQKPLTLANNQCYIESVTTDQKARGKGVASTLIHHLFHTLDYDEMILEVVDTNVNAIRLYKKLGFVVFDKKKAGFFEQKQAGFRERLYMKKIIGD